MIATIDKAGRLVIPKKLRDEMGLRPGVPLRIDFVDGRIVIDYKPVDEWEIVTGEDGFPVLHYTGERELPVVTEEMMRETLEAVRDEGVVGRL